jgi:hypothetical protein
MATSLLEKLRMQAGQVSVDKVWSAMRFRPMDEVGK